MLANLGGTAMLAAGVDAARICEDLASGRHDDRPSLAACLKAIQPGNNLMLSIVTLLGLLPAACSALLDDRLISTSEGSVEVSSTPGPPPPIVFEAGLAAYKETWNKVYPAIASSHAVFAYDRAGVGKSTASAKSRYGATIVADLRRVLTSLGIRPPYVLVGHSAGGLYMQLFARLHPTEIAGLVLIDPTHPTQFEGDGAIERRGLAASALIAAAGVIGPAQAEFNALPRTGRDVMASPALSRSYAGIWVTV